MKPRIRLLFLGWTIALAFGPARAGPGAPDADPLARIAPFPGVVAFARSHAIPIGGIAAAGPAAVPAPGDEVTLLITRYRGATCEQWIARVRAEALDEAERQEKPRPDQITYSGTGRTLRFGFTPAPLAVALAGPFTERSSPSVERDERILANARYLGYGLDAFCRVQLREMRLRQSGVLKGPGVYYSSAPPSPGALENSARVAALLHLTAEEDRITGGSWYPVGSFVDILTSVPQFRFVLLHVVDFPSVWSVVEHLGIYSGWTFGGYRADAAGFAATGLPLYRFSLHMSLNDQPAVDAVAAVVEPRPPLEACAGIVGVCASSPSDPTQRIFIQVVASRRPALP
jgi:hypothetical protein